MCELLRQLPLLSPSAPLLTTATSEITLAFQALVEIVKLSPLVNSAPKSVALAL